MDRNSDIRQVIWDSGLWASYGDAAEVMDGYHGRSLAQANWHPDRWTHLARADGTYDAETTSKEREFRDRTDVLAVQEAYGYLPGEPKPARLRLSPEDIRQLIGERPVTDHLLRRLRGQLTTISAVLHTKMADDRDVSALSAAQGRLAQLIERLEGTEPDGEADVPNSAVGPG